jgi:hypothetical protein
MNVIHSRAIAGAICALMLMAPVLTVDAQSAPPYQLRVVQAGDGTLYVTYAQSGWPLIPDEISLSDLGALQPAPEVDGVIPLPTDPDLSPSVVRVIQDPNDGTLDLIEDSTFAPLVPDPISDADLAALSIHVPFNGIIADLIVRTAVSTNSRSGTAQPAIGAQPVPAATSSPAEPTPSTVAPPVAVGKIQSGDTGQPCPPQNWWIPNSLTAQPAQLRSTCTMIAVGKPFTSVIPLDVTKQHVVPILPWVPACGNGGHLGSCGDLLMISLVKNKHYELDFTSTNLYGFQQGRLADGIARYQLIVELRGHITYDKAPNPHAVTSSYNFQVGTYAPDGNFCSAPGTPPPDPKKPVGALPSGNTCVFTVLDPEGNFGEMFPLLVMINAGIPYAGSPQYSLTVRDVT